MVTRLRWSAFLGVIALGLTAFPNSGEAATPSGTSGPVITHGADWYLRTTPSGGPAEQTFHYGVPGDVPLVGDWNGNGSETVGVVRFGQSGPVRWLLRNGNSAGPADVTFSFGTRRTDLPEGLGTVPVAGNLDPADDAYEVALATSDRATGALNWVVSRDLRTGSPVASFTFGRDGDRPIVGDWNGDGVDTVGVVRGNTWYLTNTPLTGGDAQVSFAFGRSSDLPVPGDWNGDGTDTPAVVRDAPGTEAGSYQLWLLRNSNSGGSANTSFTFGAPSLGTDFPVEVLPRLAIEVS